MNGFAEGQPAGKEAAVKKPMRYELKGLLIALGAMAVLALAILWKSGLDDRLPKDPGVTVYYNTLASQGKYYEKMSRGGTAIGWNGNYDGGIWLAEQDYKDKNSSVLFEKGEPAQPLSVWTDAKDRVSLTRVLVEQGFENISFAVKTRDGAKVKDISVFRWPLDVTGTDAVKKNSWTGRERVEHIRDEGGLFSMPKGQITVEAGYLYSIFVNWTAKGEISAGWEEYSFVTLTPKQAGITVHHPD